MRLSAPVRSKALAASLLRDDSSDIKPLVNREVLFPAWSKMFWEPSDFKIITGGRGAGKTMTTALAILIFGHTRPLRIAVVRRHRSALVESAQYTLEMDNFWLDPLRLKHDKLSNAGRAS